MRPARTFGLLVVLSVVASCILCCGRGEERPAARGSSAVHSPTPQPNSSESVPADSPPNEGAPEPLVVFDPKLLLHPADSSDLLVEMPPVQVDLRDRRRSVLVEVVVECADEKTREEIEKKKKRLGQTIVSAFSDKDSTLVKSAAGKLGIQDEIVWRLRESPLLRHQAVKQVYFKTYEVKAR
ncbi:MAG TPA: flagellar basal body-associated FliL family protein [Sumerlaeia bacterium]|nr:flagellar basal body-associated FliL family protein [Sumerlaeia bacterium]